jgi:ADP-ribose pyrophosphatase YjhB (NUDIX family)
VATDPRLEGTWFEFQYTQAMPDVLPFLERFQAIARLGLQYANNPYDLARYTELLSLTTEMYAVSLEFPEPQQREALQAQLSHLDVSSVLGGDAAIFDEAGRILLIKRKDDETWCLPCGLLEAGESPEACTVREAYEETGLRVEARELVMVHTRPAARNHAPFTLVSIVYLCDTIGGTLTHSHEDVGLQYWEIEAVPNWHFEMREKALAARAIWEEQEEARSLMESDELLRELERRIELHKRDPSQARSWKAFRQSLEDETQKT